MDFELTDEQLERAVRIAFEEDKDYLARIKEELSEEEFEKFLEECPEAAGEL